MTTKQLFGILIVCFALGEIAQAQTSGAAFLDASQFNNALGVFNPTTNVVVNLQSNEMTGGATFKGVLITQAGTSLLVFTFSKFTLQAGLNITFSAGGAGTPAVAFLSQSDMKIDGYIYGGGAPGIYAPSGGPGSGMFGGSGSAGGGPDGGGGGGYGGAGGAGGNGGEGGSTYNSDLTSQLEGGSPGGVGGSIVAGIVNLGGGGGGAIQLAALGTMTVSGTISVDGASGYSSPGSGGGGSGSGGGLILQAGVLNITSNALISANGFDGAPGKASSPSTGSSGGGGGGGGRIVIAYANSGIMNGTATAAGGAGGSSGIASGSAGGAGTVLFTQNANVPFLPVITGHVSDSGQIIFSWPASAGTYYLQGSASIGEGALWGYVAGATVIGSNFVFTNELEGAAEFFRLTTH